MVPVISLRVAHGSGSTRRRCSALLLTVALTVSLTACHKPPPLSGAPIHGWTQASVQQAEQWARARGGTETFIDLAATYWHEAPRRGGTRPDVAYAQSAKETAFGRFGGSVTPDYHNPCGLKRPEGGPDHMRFPDWTTGVRACVDHLALYAGAPGYPLAATPDPRHFPNLLGTAEIVEALGGRWAPSPTYGQSILTDYLAPMKST